MARRAIPAVPVLWLALAAAVVALAAWERWRPLSLDEALAVLADGDPDHRERLAATRTVHAQGMALGTRRGLVLSATAALALDDRRAFEVAATRLGPPAPERILPEPAHFAEAALGEPCLDQLLLAMRSEDTGRRKAAAVLYGRTLAAARLWGLTLVSELAEQGLSRTR